MAERRMFAKTIIDSDAFLDMPLSAQCLYFHLSMRADDDGFINNPKKIQRMIGAADDDLKLLIANRFIIPFESGIVVIKHWRIHNYIRADRKKDTVYPREMAQLDVKPNGSYTLKSNELLLEEKQMPTQRQQAYSDSVLPYSFDYKIRNAFVGKRCPVCGAIMGRFVEDGIESTNRIPTIQHNTPISKGGKHELGNISVICKQCNVSIKDNVTGKLNSEEVAKVWDEICLSDVGQMSVSCPSNVSIGKDSIGKVRKELDNNTSSLTEEFDALWKIYPRKQGKKKALDAYVRSRKKGTTFDEVETGIKAYSAHIKRMKIESQYIKQGSTFFSQMAWQDDWSDGRPEAEEDAELDEIF